MLVHICCSVDCDYFFRRLREIYPNEKFIGFFYDPNIHPYSEFLLRFRDTKRICDKLGIGVICGEYEFTRWLEGAKGLENEPEKGERCSFCFDFRMEKTALLARKLGEKLITTTLLMSPKKDFTQLIASLEKICSKFGLEFVAPDFRKNGGTSEQMEFARKDKLYRQNYCGCLFALNSQKKQSENYELCEPLGGQIQLGAPKYRIKIYNKVRKFEQKGKPFELYREKILNYRLKFAKVIYENAVIPSYFCFYSSIKNQKSRFNVKMSEDMFRAQRDGIILLSLRKLNSLCEFTYQEVSELMKNPPKLKHEILLRHEICGEFSLGAIIILDDIKPGKYEISCDSEIFIDDIEKVKRIH